MLIGSKHHAGFTLTELMIGSTVGLMVLGGAVQLYIINIKASNDSLQLSRLTHDVRSILSLMQRDIMRSGYWGYTPELQAIEDNPFTQQPAYLTIGAKTGETNASCILFSYDYNEDGWIGVGSTGALTAVTNNANVEQFGFRLNGNRLQMRQGGAQFSCNDGRWQTLNEETVSIDSITFTPTTRCFHAIRPPPAVCEPGEPAWLHTRLDIDLTASLSQAPAVSQSLTTTIDIRNDQWISSW